MRIRCLMRSLRGERSLRDVTGHVRIGVGELSMIERGHAIPHDKHVPGLERFYGPRGGWYPPTVLAVLHPDIRRCPGCGEELPADAPTSRVYHDRTCAAGGGLPLPWPPEDFTAP